ADPMSLTRMRVYVVGTLLVVVAALVATLGTGSEPVLGLDPQGGISVVLAPVGDFKSGSLSVARDIIENRVNGLGVAEPEISTQGDNIVVALPGVKDRDKARRLVGQTAELRFRPVLAELPPAGTTASSTTTTGAPTTTAPGAAPTTTTTLSADADAAHAAAASFAPAPEVRVPSA